ncbi:jerky protein homolog-like isoform X2 [Anastrepha ludens]|uniref:jerky protein homolog-like isoform X2 n=1 Tax=Anastrepha ludens TaxID=28586 RepID=UPI0023AEC71A|nr:jerky protein homolog-like isoform X2 [Anastrepha ludens]
MAELELCNDQLYNADELGLIWRLFPEKTYASSLEKRTPGVKFEKQRITFLCCSNATGSHKLKILVIGKAKNPRCFRNFQCLTDYKSSKSAWMTSAISKQWFQESFVPQGTSFLKEKALPIKALLLIDNAPSHPNGAELITENGQISAMFMPQNVTPLIQPMDQNAIKITKLHYRNSLLASIAATKSDLLESILIEKWEAELRTLMSNTIEFTLPAIPEWNEDIEEGNADDDHQQEDESDDDSVSEPLEKIKPTEAINRSKSYECAKTVKGESCASSFRKTEDTK